MIDDNNASEGKDLKAIERLLFQSAEAFATSIARSRERMEKQLEEVQSRLFSHMGEVEDAVELCRQDLSAKIDKLREEADGLKAD